MTPTPVRRGPFAVSTIRCRLWSLASGGSAIRSARASAHKGTLPHGPVRVLCCCALDKPRHAPWLATSCLRLRAGQQGATIRGHCKPTWATATSSTGCATPSCHLTGSRTLAIDFAITSENSSRPNRIRHHLRGTCNHSRRSRSALKRSRRSNNQARSRHSIRSLGSRHSSRNLDHRRRRWRLCHRSRRLQLDLPRARDPSHRLATVLRPAMWPSGRSCRS